MDFSRAEFTKTTFQHSNALEDSCDSKIKIDKLITWQQEPDGRPECHRLSSQMQTQQILKNVFFKCYERYSLSKKCIPRLYFSVQTHVYLASIAFYLGVDSSFRLNGLEIYS